MAIHRIALSGAGLMGKMHLELLGRNERTKLCAISDPSASAKALANAYGVPYFEHFNDLLETTQPDGVILATPNHLHVPQALACVESKIPVLIEKPLSDDEINATELVEKIEASNACVLVGHHRAHSPIMQKTQEVIASGVLGRLVLVSGSAVFMKPRSYFQQGPWRTLKGGGPILINLIHEIHNLRMMCGPIKSIHALASNAVRAYEVEDTAVISLRFVNGALGSFVLSDTGASTQSWEQTTGENPVYAKDPSQNCYSLTGTLGTLSIPSMRLQHVTEGEGSWYQPLSIQELSYEALDPLVLQLNHFLDMIEQGVPAKVSARDGLENLKAVMAIERSIREGVEIQLA